MSIFRYILGAPMQEGRARIEIKGGTAGRFVFERTASLGTIHWQPVAGAVKEITGDRVFLVDPSALPTEAYYRVQEVFV